ncbi:hypothetical protein PCANC_26881 [Puccinia coronata f. sp. avenae]|uniref:Uncharacterized protein n=1 Tax=Puccinia coronata f. sp. avenae TaxID=200324 RepID=A0A2N5S0L8_9BASI|nr:hypothetical protein PCANC_26881 [Puccinia coronata f. sp. avenae]
MTSEPARKPLSKLQRRIQAGLAAASSSSAPTQAKASGPGESDSMEIVETSSLGRPESSTSFARDFPFSPAPSSLFAPPSQFANALPRPESRTSNTLLFSLPDGIFLQPCEPNAFHGPSPDDEVLIARKGSSLGTSARRS